MAKKVVWSTRADKNFERIVNYLLENWSEKEVEAFVNKTEKTIEYILDDKVKFRKSKMKNTFEVKITKHNLLIYKEKRDSIELVMFFDTRQHPRKKKY